jgi:hypothetical protein
LVITAPNRTINWPFFFFSNVMIEAPTFGIGYVAQ